MARPVDVEELLAGIHAGDRATVSRAITLVESGRDEHRLAARALLSPEQVELALGEKLLIEPAASTGDARCSGKKVCPSSG